MRPPQLCLLALQPNTTPHNLCMVLLLLLPPDDFAVCVCLSITGRLPACLVSAHPPICTTLPAAVSYLLILDLFFNFFRYFVSKSWHEQCLWGGAAQVRAWDRMTRESMLAVGGACE